MVDYLYLKDSIYALKQNYNFLKIFSIGKSTLKNEIYCIKFGTGKKEVLYTAGIHANEWITSLLLIKFIRNLCNAFVSNSKIYEHSAKYLYENCSLYIIPMINPDGINLVNNFYDKNSNVYISASNIAKNFPFIPFPSGWKANINGVDLNSQFPADWETGKKIKSNFGFLSYSPRDFAGPSPLSEPESKSIYDFILIKNFSLCLCFHSQGEVIYWKYKDFLPKNSLELAKEFAHVSGYELEDTPYNSSFGGLRDWFIKTFNKPAFTIEVGKGTNPLPLSQFSKIYHDNLGILVSGLL